LEERTIDVTANMQGTISFSDPVNLRIRGSFECRVGKGAAVAQEVSGSPPVLQQVRQGQERRQWPRLDLSDRKGKGILIRATLPKGEPINGYVRNISGGGVCE
jgi:hypothetical protein